MTEQPETDAREPSRSTRSTRSTRSAPTRRTGRRLNSAEGARGNVVKIRLSDQEYVEIKALAAAMKCSPQRVYTSSVASNGAVFGRLAVVKQSGLVADLHGANRMLAAVGRNLNQVARGVNAGGEVGEDVEHTLAAVRECVERINAVLDAADLA